MSRLLHAVPEGETEGQEEELSGPQQDLVISLADLYQRITSQSHSDKTGKKRKETPQTLLTAYPPPPISLKDPPHPQLSVTSVCILEMSLYIFVLISEQMAKSDSSVIRHRCSSS